MPCGEWSGFVEHEACAGDEEKSGQCGSAPGRRGTVRIFEFMSANRSDFSIAAMVRVLGGSESGYHA